MSTRIDGVVSTVSQCLSSASYIDQVMALRAWGRLKVIVAAASCCSNSTSDVDTMGDSFQQREWAGVVRVYRWEQFL